MSEFDELCKKLLEQKPELTQVDLDEKIQQKKEKIGAGYLTDQGALFLIAADLGVTLTESLKIEMKIKDLYVGAKEVTLDSRVLNFSPAKEFNRKDGSTFLLRTMTVYDDNSTASVKLWDEKAKLSNIENLKPGDLVKIIKAYVKTDLNGSPTLNVGSGSSIEIIDSESKIPSIDSITRNLNSLKENEKDLVVSGTIFGTINSMQFTNSRGKPGKALRLRLKDGEGNSLRVVLWGKDESDIPNLISPEAKTRLLGVKTKLGMQGLEIHGNEATIIEIEGKKDIEPILVRIISISKNDSGKSMLLCVDNTKHIFNVVDSSGKTDSFNDGDVIELMPSKVFGYSLIIDDNAFIRKIDDEKNIPTISEMRTKISDVKAENDYCVEAIILKEPERREVKTKSGDMISLSEMFVEDDSGQIWVKGWRNQARLIDKCSIGEIVSISGINAKAGLEGKIELFLSPFSKITKKN